MRVGKFHAPGRKTVSAESRSGFTLFEVILAIGLTALVMVAIYSAIQITGRLQMSSRDRYESGQIQRSVIRMMTRDINSIVFYIPKDDAEDEDAGGQVADQEEEEPIDDAAEAVTTVEVVDATSAYAQEVTGVYGDAGTLLLHINSPPRDSNYTLLAEGGSLNSRSSDLRSVSYFLASTGGDPLPAMVASNALASTGLQANRDGVVGLARMDGDRLSMEAADVAADIAAMAEQSRVIAPEIVGLQFRYFDGTTWLEAWDTEFYGSLPRAIEVRLGMKQDAAYRSPNGRQIVSSPMTEPPPKWQTYVIHLPITEPPAEEDFF